MGGLKNTVRRLTTEYGLSSQVTVLLKCPLREVGTGWFGEKIEYTTLLVVYLSQKNTMICGISPLAIWSFAVLEMMIDLETLDTKNSAVVLSIGAVVWGTVPFHGNVIPYVDRFYRVLEIDSQVSNGRTISQDTLLWWLQQDQTAKDEAFAPVRCSVDRALKEFNEFANRYPDIGCDYPEVSAFWASPATFDFPIWEDLALTFHGFVPWTYRQKYDVRTVVREASYSAKDHEFEGHGVPHTPVYDCEWQISILNAARVKLKRKMGEKTS